jgi:serine/threonine-protein kinase
MTDLASRLATALADRYTIERELGAGGMATVYLAHDVKHDRKVALKVLRPELAAVLGADRFVQEIKTTASLQHPHILPLFDSGEADSFLYYVMPYVEGETLRDKLNRETQLGIYEAVKITTEVADALHYAHEQGVIHRDIKPENILLHNGRPMVADFGIALAVSAAAGGRMTETGLSLGTPHYMSPEQATAEKDLTNRSDIYSLGAVLYEMLTGDPPHTGSTAHQIIMKIVTEEAAPVTTVRKSVPRNVDAAVRTALAKVPADRFASAHQLVEALEDPAFTTRGSSLVAPADSDKVRRWRATAIGALAGLIAVAGWALFGRSPTSTTPVSRFAHSLNAGEQLSVGYAAVELSPDGESLVYSASGRLHLRTMSELEGRPIPGSDGGSVAPFFSPDGLWIAYYSTDERQLKKIPATGGVAVDVSAAGERFFGGNWGDDETIVFADEDGIHQVDVAAETSRLIVPTTAPEEVCRPRLLPGQRWIMFTLATSAGSDRWNEAQIVAQSLDTGERLMLTTGGDARYVSTGHLVYAVDTVLFAVAFDLGSMRVTGVPFVIAEEMTRAVNPIYNGGTANYAVSEAGVFAYVPRALSAPTTLVWVDRDGDVEPFENLSPRTVTSPRLSPDGTRVVFATVEPADIWVYEIAQQRAFPLTMDGNNRWPEWVDDSLVAYTSGRSGVDNIFVQQWDRVGEPLQVTDGTNDSHLNAASPDGNYLAVHRHLEGNVTVRLTVSPRGGMGADSAGNEVDLGVPGSITTFSHDSKWIAYVSRETGRSEVHVAPNPGPGDRIPVTRGGGSQALWGRGELFYRQGNSMMAVRVETVPSLRIGDAVALFEGRYVSGPGGSRHYDATDDGLRFVMVAPGQPPDSTESRQQIIVVLNWFDELRRLGSAN